MQVHRLPVYDDNLTGLPYPVRLIDVAEEAFDASNESLGISVPDSEQLAAALALALCAQPHRLTGDEVRFIRRTMDMTGIELARALEMDNATLSRWEGGKQEVGGWAEKSLRMMAVLRLAPHAPGSSIRAEDVPLLRLLPRPPGWNPTIEVTRSSVVDDAWDAVALPRAA
jgi:DNA-binding transcriptional regulator YiaG